MTLIVSPKSTMLTYAMIIGLFGTMGTLAMLLVYLVAPAERGGATTVATYLAWTDGAFEAVDEDNAAMLAFHNYGCRSEAIFLIFPVRLRCSNQLHVQRLDEERGYWGAEADQFRNALEDYYERNGMIGALDTLRDPDSHYTRLYVLGFVGNLVVLFILVSLGCIVVHVLRTRREHPWYLCVQCGYDLRGQRNQRCPECGKEVTRGNAM